MGRKQVKARAVRGTVQNAKVGPAVSGKSEDTTAKARLEPWARLAQVLALSAIGIFVALGFESPAPWHRNLYRAGPLILGLGSALLLATGLTISLRRRPFIQRGRLVAFTISGICLLIGGCPMPYPSPYAQRIGSIEFDFPLEGEWSVRFGGTEVYRNPLVLQPERRFGYEFWRVNTEGQADSEATQGGRVLAPCPGLVLGQANLERGGTDGAARSRAFVILALEDGSHLFLGGLDPASLAVSPGETVARGTFLGLVGQPSTPGQPASLGLHLQDTALLGDGVGMPLRFGTLLVQGELRENVVPQGALLRGDGAPGWRVARPDPGP